MATQKQGKSAIQFAEHSSFLSHGINRFHQVFEDVLISPDTLIINDKLGEGSYKARDSSLDSCYRRLRLGESVFMGG